MHRRSSARKIKANRANARASTGPRTKAGKERAAKNSRRHGLSVVWITCNPDNWPSRRTCERLGGTLVEIVKLPEDNDMYQAGEREKCRWAVPIP